MAKKTAILKKEGFSFVLPFLVAISTAILLLLLQFSMICYMLCKIDLPIALLSPLSTAATCVAVLAAGILLAFLLRRKGMISGFFLGLVFFLIILIAALIQGKDSFSALAFVKLIALCTTGGIGGYLGILLSEKKRRNRQRG